MEPTQTCTVDGCEKSGKLVKGVCQAHYRRTQRGMDLTKPLRPFDPGATCSIDGCDRPLQSRGMCKMHAKRDRVHGDPSIVKHGGPGYGEQHHAWLGDAIGYKSAHLRVVRARGFASEHACDHCGQPAQEWSYDHTDPNPLVGEHRGSQLQYSGDPAHFIPLCVPCHRAADALYRKIG